MSYTDDAVKAKLSALNETQDSIVTVAQWIMFHRYVDELRIASTRLPILTSAFPGDTPIEPPSCGLVVSGTAAPISVSI